MRKLFVLLLLLLPVMAIAGGATAKCEFTLASPAMVGTTELKSGKYYVRVEGTAAVLESPSSGKSFTVPVKLETLETKFGGDTRVNIVPKDGKSMIDSVIVGHSKTKIVFGQ
jgi:hypothetical protein